jgi:hypothetical protein
LVYKDWSARCTGSKKYGEPNKEAVNLLKKKSRRVRRELRCVGPECRRVIEYKEKLLAEEARKGRSA